MTEPLHAYVGRQALFDRRLQVVGYELLYRNSEENRARFTDADKATAETMLNAFVELGLDALAPGLPVWVNLPEAFLLGKYPIPLPADRTVLEVLEDVPVTPELIASLERYRADGFRIALDDFILTDATRPLLDLAWAIKVDVLNVAARRGREAVQRAQAHRRDRGRRKDTRRTTSTCSCATSASSSFRATSSRCRSSRRPSACRTIAPRS